MDKAQRIARRPVYRNGQLLMEQDFADEQAFHVEALARHTRGVCGFGVVRGLEIRRDGDRALTVTPGYAVDRLGQEIELAQPMTLELDGLATGSHPVVSIGYRVDAAAPDSNRADCVALVRIAGDVGEADVRLGRVQLDANGLIGDRAVSQDDRDIYLTMLAPGSVLPEALAPRLRTGWLTMAFHPSPLPADSKDPETRKLDYQPPFRIGATRARSFREVDGKANAAGAAGTMTIVLPIGVQKVRRFRIAGAENEKGITATLFRGGFKDGAYVREVLARIEVEGSGKPFLETADVPEAVSAFDEMSTLAVDLRSVGQCEISLVGVEVSC